MHAIILESGTTTLIRQKIFGVVLLSLFLNACFTSNQAPVTEQGEVLPIVRPIIVDSQSDAEVFRSTDRPASIVQSPSVPNAPSLPQQASARATQNTTVNASGVVVSQTRAAQSNGGIRRGIIRQPLTQKSKQRSDSSTESNTTTGQVSRASTPVSPASAPLPIPIPIPIPSPVIANTEQTGSYRVKRGDTLYSIAFQFDLDFRVLAAVNDLSTPYTIFVDQQLSLDTSSAAPNTGQTTTGTLQWQWPLRGRLIRSFNAGGADNSKGIDIAGQFGDAVLAASSGEVVYSGSGVKGAGDLIIVRHSDRYLSTYSNNSSRLVSAGTKISAGQKIAEVGLMPGSEGFLHFEISLDGKSVDPQQHLPK